MSYEIHESAVLPPRAATFLAIAALHAAFAYLFISGLAQSAFKVFDEPMRVVPVAPVPKPTPVQPPPVAPPQFGRITIDLPVPPAPVPLPTEETVTSAYTPDPTPAPGTNLITPPPEPIRLIGTNRIPNAEHYYPPHLKRQGIEGATVVRACVDEGGRLQGDPIVQHSSGYEGFDKGAVQAARDGRYARATQGGKPIPNCYDYRIVFDIR